MLYIISSRKGDDSMSFIDKLEFLMKSKNISNLHVLSSKSKIPYSTLRGFYTKGTENIKRTTLISLAKFFNCSIDYLADDEITEISPYGNSSLEEDELKNFENTLKKHGLLNKNDVLTDKTFKSIMEYIDANKKFILFKDESHNSEK